jgi:polysaccharide export outer membrane protein
MLRITSCLDKSIARALLACALLSAGAACGASGKYVWVHERPPAVAGERVSIGAGDLIEVHIYGDEQSSSTGRVLDDGTLTLPLLGPVKVAGQQPEDLAAHLTQQLKQFIAAPNVTVVIRESVVSVSVIGEVRAAKTVKLVAPAKVLEALAEAGGLTEFADGSCIFVLRQRGEHIERIRFSYDKLVEAEPAASKFQLKTGDVLVVE